MVRPMLEASIDYEIRAHKKWLNSGMKIGIPGDFSYMIPCTFDFKNFDLRSANFKEANLYGIDFRGAKLDSSILECSTLEGTKWLTTDIPWFIAHPGYSEWCNTIQVLEPRKPITFRYILKTLYSAAINLYNRFY